MPSVRHFVAASEPPSNDNPNPAATEGTMGTRSAAPTVNWPAATILATTRGSTRSSCGMYVDAVWWSLADASASALNWELPELMTSAPVVSRSGARRRSAEMAMQMGYP